MAVGIMDRRHLQNATRDIETYHADSASISTAPHYADLLKQNVSNLEAAVAELKAAAVHRDLENDETTQALKAFDEALTAIREEYDSLEAEFRFRVQHKNGEHYSRRDELLPVFEKVFEARSYKIRGSDQLQLPFFETFLSVLEANKEITSIIKIDDLKRYINAAVKSLTTLISERHDDENASQRLFKARETLLFSRRLYRNTVQLALQAQRREDELNKFSVPLHLYKKRENDEQEIETDIGTVASPAEESE